MTLAWLLGATATIRSCTFERNEASGTQGGAISVTSRLHQGGGIRILHSAFRANKASGKASSLSILGDSDTLVEIRETIFGGPGLGQGAVIYNMTL